VLRTGATNLLRNLRTTLFSSVESRQTFPGLATFYRALQRGNRHEVRNPIFYVSSSPWNLHDLLEEFMALNRIPLGPMFLTDLGIDQSKFIRSSHRDHKLAAIETLLEFYPHLRFILVGDSGQHDAEIYRTVVERHPGRVLAVYLRTLSDAPRRDEGAVVPMKIIEQAGVEAVLCPTLVLAAENAAGNGWIPSSVIDAIKADVERSTTETPLG
jgi:phosphatidate phosphatase APP1